jgi:hypothetical protein
MLWCSIMRSSQWNEQQQHTCRVCVDDVPSNSMKQKRFTAAAIMAILMQEGDKPRATRSVPFVLLWALLRMAEPGRRCHQPPLDSGWGGGKTPGQACGCREDLHSPGAPPRPGPHCRLLRPARFLQLGLACYDIGPDFRTHHRHSSANPLQAQESKSTKIAI